MKFRKNIKENKSKKAQAAMEFLMTYGWAILIVLIAIGALAYYGVLSPSKVLPERCILPQGLGCLDSKVTPSEITLVVQNNLGEDIYFSSLTFSEGNCTNNVSSSYIYLNNGEKTTITTSGCNNGNAGSQYKSDINMSYWIQTTGGFEHKIKGEIIRVVE